MSDQSGMLRDELLEKVTGGVSLGNLSVNNPSKISSKPVDGLRMNRSAEDSAGLSITEKMRGRVMGLDAAATNAQDGIVLVQEPSGDPEETEKLMERLRKMTEDISG